MPDNENSSTEKHILDEIAEFDILEEIGDGISIQDADYRVVYQNKVHKSFVGEHVGELCYEAYEKRDQTCNGCPVAKAFHDGGTHTEVRSAPTERGLCHFEITASPLRDAAGRIIAGIESVRDITEQKMAQDLLRLSEEKNKSILSAIPDLMFRLSSTGEHLEFYTSNLNELYLDPAEFMGKRVDEVLPQDVGNQYLSHIDQTLKAEAMQVFEYQLAFPDGPRFYECRMVRSGEDEVLTIVRNITKRKTAETDREQLLAELSRKNKELEQVLYITSHDLRSPLINVLGFSKELSYSLNELMSHLGEEDMPANVMERITPIVDADIPESLEFIKKSILKMDALLSSLLNLSRMGRLKLHIENIDMDEMIGEVISSHEYALQAAGITTEVADLPLCRGDRVQVNQIFSNLLDNAVKYSDPERSAVIKVSGYSDGDQSVFCVEDNGIGIDPRYHQRIFEIFYQLEPDKVMGEGLGLTIVNSLVERMQGSVWIDSKKGGGSRFFVSLPA